MATGIPIMATAGAIPVKNAKGEVSMRKVKVQRYVAGKRPEYAPDRSESDSESDQEGRLPFEGRQDGAFLRGRHDYSDNDARSSGDEEDDPRLQRLRHREVDSDEEEEVQRRRRGHRRPIREPEILSSSDEDDQEEPGPGSRVRHRTEILPAAESSDEEEELSDDELERRREQLRLKAKERSKEEEVMAQEDEGESGEEADEESEYEEYSESDDEDETGPRLKPMFVRKRDRITLQETEKEQQRLKDLQLEQKRVAEDRKKQTVKMVEETVRRDVEKDKTVKDDRLNLEAVLTEDESEELAYEQWKLRELKRIKRDKEEREALEKDKHDLERIHNMSEEERRAYLRANPKVITNKAIKGKYKFLQKYYHRGVFFLDNEDDVYKQDFAQPTLEDHFDRTVLPTVMQVKNFGMAGRTKYTHLVDQDTTDFNSAWLGDSTQNMKFFTKHAGGMRDVFDRPSAKKRKK